jgi:hypothetical protein
MKVLKFTLDQELPDTEYIEETLGLNDALTVSEFLIYFSESLGLNDDYSVITEESFSDTIGLGDSHTIILPEDITEILGLGDILFQYDYTEIIEQLGLGDAISESMSLYVELNENIGFTDGGYGYLKINYEIRWRTRTKKLTYGYGAAPYGDHTSYGDGDVINELKEFKVKVIRLSDSSVLRTATIPIVNKSYPDGSAIYTYTAAMNVSDNGYFEPNLRFEVYQVDINDVWSPADYIDITASFYKGDLV